MSEINTRTKRILIGIAATILLGIIGASMYRPQTFQEYLKKKQEKSYQTGNKAEASGPKQAVEDFIKLVIENKIEAAAEYLLKRDENLSSADQVINFLEIKVPLSFNYEIKDISSNNRTGVVNVNLVTPNGILEKDIEIENVGGEWKLTRSTDKNNNMLKTSLSGNKITILIPQDMLVSDPSIVEIGESYKIFDTAETMQIAVFVMQQDISDTLSDLINCNNGTCDTKEINGATYETFEMIDASTNEAVYSIKTQKNGTFYTIVGIGTTPEKLEEVKRIVSTTRI